MTDIEINAKTDRELLIMIADKLNTTCDKVDNVAAWKEGNGTPGAQFQLRVMWACFIAIAVKLWTGK